MNLPDNFSAPAYVERWGRDHTPEPSRHAATAQDLTALRNVRAASAAFLAVLRANPWGYDCAETVSWADHVAEQDAVDRQIAAAVEEVMGSLMG
jgi:hypothetical protein